MKIQVFLIKQKLQIAQLVNWFSKYISKRYICVLGMKRYIQIIKHPILKKHVLC